VINEPTYSNRELLLERDELVSKLAAERQRNSDLQQHCYVLEGAALRCVTLERMVYECVSLRDVMAAGLSEELYNQIVTKFDVEIQARAGDD
jgi:hypothetical protein